MGKINEELNQEEMKKIRNYMVTKYEPSYLSAITKLFVCDLFARDCYDKEGILKPEYTLTAKEKEALMLYIPELDSVLSKTDCESNDFDQRYEAFLSDIRENTKKVVLEAEDVEENKVVPWDVVGVEFVSWEIEKKYGKDIYQKACEEVPYEDDGVHRMFNRDFKNAKVKLGHIIHERVSASPLMDLDLFITLLDERGIPSYIDYENNVFYYNAQPEEVKKDGMALSYKG